MLDNNKKSKVIFTIVAVVLLITTWYFLKVQGITMTAASELEYQSEEGILAEEVPEEVKETVEENEEVLAEEPLENAIETSTEGSTENAIEGSTENVIEDSAENLDEELIENSLEVPAEETIENSISEAEQVEQKVISMSECDFYDKTDEIEVFVHADEGNFPEGTKMVLKAVPKEDIEEIAKGATSDNTEFKDVIAVDIIFIDKAENEIEPVNPSGVHVILKSLKEIEGANKEVFHIDDNGETEKITDVQDNVAEFDSVGFSIYAIVGTDDTRVYYRTYEFRDIDTNPLSETYQEYVSYQFLTQSEEKLTSQKLKNGDKLNEVGTPYHDNYVFNGWYIGDENGPHLDANGKPDLKIDFDSVINDISADETVYVYAVYDGVYYVTFYQYESNYPQIYEKPNVIQTTKITDSQKRVLISDVIAPQMANNRIFFGWIDGTTEHSIYGKDEDGNITTITETYIENIQSNKTLYPLFVEAYWLRFVAGETGSGAKYVPAKFVRADNPLQKLPTTTRDGYTFDGWYTSDGNQITDGEGNVLASSGLLLSEETVLYAHWTPNNTSRYSVVFWRQKVTDDKNATDDEKTYDYAESRVVNNAKTGDPVSVTRAHMSKSGGDYTGFHYARSTQNSEVVNANGSTVINVYYDRDLMEVNFYYQNSHAPSEADTIYTYTVTTSVNNNTQYYGLMTDGSYKEIEHDTGSVYYTYGSGNNTTTYTGTFYKLISSGWWSSTYDATEYNGSNLPPSYDNTTYYAKIGNSYSRLTRKIEYSWTYTDSDGNTVTYSGSTYTRDSDDSYKLVTYTGLYGQTFDKYNYTWPSEYKWNTESNGSGTGQTFLTGFTKTLNPYDLYDQGTQGSYVIYHYKQGLDGKYYTTEGNRYLIYTSDGNFNLTSKFTGFTVNSYNTGNNGYNVNGGSHTNMNDSPSTYPLHVYHTRNKYTITYYVDGTIKYTTPGIYYESPLESYNYELSNPNINVEAPENYEFKGWYADATLTQPYDFSGTLPAANVSVYAKFVPKKYRVNLEPDGGVIDSTMGATYYNVTYGELPKEYKIERNFIEDSSGTYKYVFVNGADDPDGNIKDRTATYVPLDTGEVYDGTLYRPIVFGKDPVYTLVGWYEVLEDGSLSSTPFDFSSYVNHPTTLRAVWQLSGGYKIAYNPTSKVKFTTIDGVEAETTVSGKFTQENPETLYSDGANVIIAKSPEVDTRYVFDGWEIVEADAEDGTPGKVLDNNDNKYYQPGDELKLNAIRWADNSKVVHIRAHYSRTEDSNVVSETSITFHSNGGEVSGAISLITNLADHAKLIIEDNQMAIIKELFINDTLKTYGSEYFTREGYNLVGWSFTQGDNNTVDFGVGVDIGVDNLDLTAVNTRANKLYAVWERKPAEITVNKLDKDNNQKISGAVFNIKLGDADIETLADLNEPTENINNVDELADGKIKFSGLLRGSETENVYTLTEVEAPKGYYRFENPIQFYIGDDDEIHIIESDKISEYVFISDDGAINVKNVPMIVLPKSGGSGIYINYIIGIGFMFSAIVIIKIKKEKNN